MREHGTNACYRFGPEPGGDWRKGCRCQPCRTAATYYTKVLENRRAKGIETLFDNTEARAHLRRLSAAGVGYATVSKVTGLNRGTVQKIAQGVTKRSRPETIDKILAVNGRHRRPGALIDAGPTWRLIEEMLAEGYTRTRIAHELGCSGPGLQVRRTRVRQATATAIEEIHARLMAPVIARREMHAERQRRYRETGSTVRRVA